MADKILYSMGEVAEMFDVKTSLIRHWEAQFSVLQPKRNKKGNRLFTQEDVEHLKVIYHLVKERGMTLEGAKRAMKRQAAGGDGGGIHREAELMTRLRHIRALLVEVREDLKTGGEGIVDDEKEAADGPTPEAVAPRRRKKAVVKIAPEEPEETGMPAVVEPEAAPVPTMETAPVPTMETAPAEAEASHFAEPDRVEEEPFAAPLPEEEPAFAEPQIVEEIPAEAEEPDWSEEAAAEPEPEPEPVFEEIPAAEDAEPTLEEAPAKKPEPQGGEPKPRGRRGRRKSDDDNKELFAFYEQSLF